MKKLLLVLILCKVFTSCNGQNKSVHFTEEPLQLSGFDFDLDIPYFFNDESVFRNNGDIAMRAEEENIEIEVDGKEQSFEYVRYSQWSSRSSIKVAAYKDFMFGNIVLCTDLADEKTYLVGAEQGYLTPIEVDNLVKHLKDDLGVPTPDDQIANKNDNVSYEWYLDDKVIKMVLNMKRDHNVENPQADWQSDTYKDNENLSVKIFMATKEFDNALESAYSFSGMLVDYR